MLLTDGNPNDTEDLRVYESAILAVANTEGIDLAAKLDLATEEISEDILGILLDHTRASDPQSTIRRTMGVSDVVVSPQMKRWHAAHTLEVVYRDAFNNQLNDRYQAKFNEYHELSRNARERTLGFGIGLALSPLPQAQIPAFGFVAGSIPATTYFVQVSWVSAAGQMGAPSAATTYDAPANSVAVVTAVNPPSAAMGFNVYMGLTADAITLQNSLPIAAGSSFTLSDSGLVVGAAPGSGQAADIYIVGGPMLRRG
jgi:hypothetical protein